MKSVLISIRPQWCEMIANGKKTIEVRKSRPKLETPFKCYIYCTLPPTSELFGHDKIREYANELIRLQNGRIVYGYGMQLVCDDRPYGKDNFLCRKVIGEFVCDNITGWGVNPLTGLHDIFPNELAQTCISSEDFQKYACRKWLYGWHISDLKIYDTPRELSEFKLSRPPQSWQYVEEL